MATIGFVKKLRNIMRSDAGINGDSQRIEQMVWMIFLKVYDTQEYDWECEDDNFKSIIPEDLRWRNWARTKDDNGKIISNDKTSDELYEFVNNTLFPVLKGESSLDGKYKGIVVTNKTPMGQAIIQKVFKRTQQYMKDPILLRQALSVVDEIELDSAKEIHLFGDIYEDILKELQSAGSAGEFYTPRAVTEFIIKMLDPRLGEIVGDFAMGTAGFLVSALKHLESQKKTAEDVELFQNSVVGQEWKPFPFLLAAANLMLHGITNPNIINDDSLDVDLNDFRTKGKVDVIAMNPPYGGCTSASVKMRFKKEFRTSETADLFMVLIMARLKHKGRAAVVLPDGFLFGNDMVKNNIKMKLLKEFNLHTIIRLPGSVFSPYTSIATNILFFNNEIAEDAPYGFSTKEVWFYRMDMPEGYINFSKTNPMKIEHTKEIQKWWKNRKEIVISDNNIKSKCCQIKELIDADLNFDICKYPKEEIEILRPDILLKKYWDERDYLQNKIDNALDDISRMLGIKL